jgi:hypothetical protein
MVTGGVELVVGVKRDAQCGPVLLVGLGGVLVEVLRDTAPDFHEALSESFVLAMERGFGTLRNTNAQLEFESYLEASGW